MVKVFSFCLYGPPNPKYYPLGTLQNIDLIGTHFPDWKVYLYTSPDVDPNFLEQLATYSNVVVRPTGKLGSVNMFYRFFAIDEPDVEIMMVRDLDSRVHWKDRWAIHEFINNPKFEFHIIRDNVEHTSKIMGGMWGMRKTAGICISDLYKIFLEHPTDRGYGADQSFLTDYIYPYVLPKALIHYSNGRMFTGENAVEFPFEYVNEIYCGRNENESFMDSSQPAVSFKKIQFKDSKISIKSILSSLKRRD
jgi:protein O-GlcNAc transferase